MRLLKCLLYKNDCYKKYIKNIGMTPVGIGVHSTAKAGKVLSRFVQPHEGQTDGMEIDGKVVGRDELLAVLGKNKYANDWNRSGIESCVHYFIGTLADGSYGVVNTLPPTMPCWGVGSGPNGSYNGCYKGVAQPPLYIQFEMIEDESGDPAHARKLYELAVELCADLSVRYPTIKPENVISHKEAHARGYGTDHGDPENYWKRCGVSFTMAQFRRDVEAKIEDMKKPSGQTPHPKHPFTDVPADKWYAPAVQWCFENGITDGVDATHYAPNEPCTRAQMAVFLQRLAGMLQK